MRNLKIIPLLLAASVFTANAQKLPKIQEGSVYAPDNIKVDGKLTEWNDQLQAYNVSNFLYYTVSNNDNNLYLSVRMKGGLGSRKVFRGGITFKISPTSKSTDDISVAYPAIKAEDREANWDSPVGLLTSTPSEARYKRLYDDTVANKKEIDDLVSSSNKTVKDVYKDIYIIGMKGITDELISIYNEEGIKLAGVFNRQMEYTYELAIPLKCLGDAINKGSQFRYNIKLNANPIVRKKGAPPPFHIFGPPGRPDPEGDYLNNNTDFSGEYTLAKKK